MEKPEVKEMFETFCFMAVEEFLMKKRMQRTLDVFREEWDRPSEVIPLPVFAFRMFSF